MGYVAATREVTAQIESPDWFAVHVFATSSGGTQAGMLLGAHLAGIPDSVRLLGISVDQPAAASAPRIAALAADGARLLGLDWTPPVETILVDDGYCGAGYAVVTAREREAILLLARLEGILVDPVYTGRALAGLLDLVQRGAFAREQRVLFWHTGGTAALSAFARDLLPAS